MTIKKNGASKKSGAKKSAAKKGGAKKATAKKATAKMTTAALAIHEHLFADAEQLSFMAVCQVDGALTGNTTKPMATQAAFAHKAQTGHIVKIIQSQKVG